MPDFSIKAGDLLPLIQGNLTYSDGSYVDLTGSTVKFVVRDQRSGTTKINAVATIEFATSGIVQYQWVSGDTDTPGLFSAEWVVTNPQSRTQTFPTDGYLSISVEESLSSMTSPSRLVTLGDVKSELSITGTRQYDARLLGFIDTARYVVENITGPILPVVRTDFFDGGTVSIQLPERFIASVDSVTETIGNVTYTLTNQPITAAVDNYGFTFDPETNTVTRRSVGQAVPFAPGRNNVEITYHAGAATIPANVRMATVELIRDWWQNGKQGMSGASGLNADTQPATPGSYDVAKRVQQMLKPSRRAPAVG